MFIQRTDVEPPSQQQFDLINYFVNSDRREGEDDNHRFVIPDPFTFHSLHTLPSPTLCHGRGNVAVGMRTPLLFSLPPFDAWHSIPYWGEWVGRRKLGR